MRVISCALILASLSSSDAFTTSRPVIKSTRVFAAEGAPDDGNLLNGLKAGFSIFRKGISTGDGFKQSVADALSGPEFDLTVANERIDSYLKSSSVVVFSWTVSGFSKKAKNLLNSIGATYEAVELDQPWSDGNPIRSALGRRIGRTSVPAIFIDGVYIGGCDDGPSDEAPGLIPLAFQGKLRPLLIAAGSIRLDPTVDFKSTGVAQKVVESAVIDTKPVPTVVKATVGPIESSEEYIVSSTVSRNQKKCLPNDKFVSSTVSKNQKLSTPADVFVSSTVSENMKKAFIPATAAPIHAVKVAAVAPAAVVAAVVAPVASPPVTAAAPAVVPFKAAKGFYNKKNNDDELCPVEEECEL